MAVTDTAPPPKKGPSLVIQLVVLLAMTVAAAGLGWVTGGMLGAEVQPAAEADAAGKQDAGGHGADAKADAGGHGAAKEEAPAEGEPGQHVEFNPRVIALAPLTTNVAAPSDVWIRMEASIVVDGVEPPPADLPDIIHQDLLAFIRTLKLHQIDGASGFRHFKADIEERAAIRSAGLVKQVLVRTLLFE